MPFCGTFGPGVHCTGPWLQTRSVRQCVRVIVGIDPGLANCGFAVVACGATRTVLDIGTIHTTKDSAQWTHDVPARVYEIRNAVSVLCGRYQATELAIEAWVYVGGRSLNASAALSTSRLIQSIEDMCRDSKIDTQEYAAVAVRQRVAGRKDADDAMMRLWLPRYVLDCPDLAKVSCHAVDALAIAVCHSMSLKARTQLPLTVLSLW